MNGPDLQMFPCVRAPLIIPENAKLCMSMQRVIVHAVGLHYPWVCALKNCRIRYFMRRRRQKFDFVSMFNFFFLFASSSFCTAPCAMNLFHFHFNVDSHMRCAHTIFDNHDTIVPRLNMEILFTSMFRALKYGYRSRANWIEWIYLIWIVDWINHSTWNDHNHTHLYTLSSFLFGPLIYSREHKTHYSTDCVINLCIYWRQTKWAKTKQKKKKKIRRKQKLSIYTQVDW